MTVLKRGEIVRFVPGNGFGFVRVDGYDEDVFFHINQGRCFISTESGVGFSQERLADPPVEDIPIYLTVITVKGKLRAEFWGYAAAYDRMLAEQEAA